MTQIDKLIQYWQSFYFAEIVLLISELTALLLAYTFMRKTNIGKFFIFYILFEFTLLIVDQLLLSNSNLSTHFTYQFLNITNPLISFVELSAYYYFFHKVISNPRMQTLIKTLFLIFSILMIVFLITKFRFISPRLNYMANLISVIEFAFILPPCFAFYYQMMNTMSEFKLLDRPSFWIVTGIFFFSIISIPHFLIGSYYVSNKIEIRSLLIAAFLYFPFSLNFIFLSKAFLCKKTLTT